MILTLLLLAQDWKPAAGPLTTRFSEKLTPETAHPEYPRPQMVRKDWLNLNGLWDYAVRAKEASRPESFDGKILVPFPIESALSGVMKRVSDREKLWTRRQVNVPAAWRGRKVLLHFGAVDWEAVVWANGIQVGEHRGGYDPFTCDVTTALGSGQTLEVVVAAWDPTDSSTQPRGKQVHRPGGIFYTPTTGIWQTVWIEPVPEQYIQSLKIVPIVDRSVVSVTTTGAGPVRISSSDASATGNAGEPIELPVPGAKLWSPDSPHLYGLRVEAGADAVDSYFGMRKISLGKDEAGVLRLFLNNKALFQYGPLDQGFWPDGLYTAPSDAALKYDIEVTKQLGFNMARKHVKVEPARWYYWCDVLGLLVWQDMPSGDRSINPNDPDIVRTPASAEQYRKELKAMIDALHNHPSIVMWVPFNEGWGQFDTKAVSDWTKQYDPTRLVNATSGWTDRGVSDVRDLHVYPGPGGAPPEAARAIVLGEFGGLGLPVKGHTWQSEKNWGYKSFTTSEALTEAYVGLVRRLRPLIGDGLAAAVYTQTTDVEVEVNGLLTYDRAMIKLDAALIGAENRKVYLPPPKTRVVIPTSQKEGQTWRFTTAKPADGWEQAAFDDAGWKEAPGGFGTKDTPGTVVRTEWSSNDIWIRRTVELPADLPKETALLIHHDEDAEIHVNGKRVAAVTGYTTSYTMIPLAPGALAPGRAVIAVHCKQTGGGQYIDVGIAALLSD